MTTTRHVRVFLAGAGLLSLVAGSACAKEPEAYCGPLTASDPALGGKYSEADLPRGACGGHEGAECAVTAYEVCACNADLNGGYAGYSGYTCTCADGAWQCKKTSPASQVCRKASDPGGCRPGDAGRPEAGTDAGVD